MFENNGRSDNYPLALAILSDIRHHIIYAIATHLVARYRRKGVSHAGVEKFEVVINLGCCAHRRTWVARIDLLLDGNSGCNTRNKVNVWLIDTSQELTGIGREALHITALSLGKNSIEGKCRLARA